MSGRGLGEKLGKVRSLLLVALAYLTAVGAAWVVATAIGPERPVWALGLGYLTSALIIFVWSLACDNGSMFDAWVERAPTLRRGVARVRPRRGVPDLRVTLVLIVVWIWAVRLTSNWARRTGRVCTTKTGATSTSTPRAPRR